MGKEGRTAFGRRWAATAGVAAVTTILLGVPLAGSAAAAATSVSASPATQNVAAGSAATITATSQGTPTQISYTVVSGPTNNYPNATACTNPTQTTSTCNVTEATPGTYTVRVFDDTNTNGKFDAGEPAASDVTVVYSGAPTAVTVAPHTRSDATGSCAAFTATATDSGGRPSVNSTITVQVTQTSGTGTTSFLSTCVPTGGATVTQISNPTTNGTDTLTYSVNTDNTGKAIFGFTSTNTGTAAVKAFYDVNANHTPDAGEPNDSATETFTAGGTAAASSLSVTPTSDSQYTGATSNFVVTVKNSSGQVLPGVVVNYSVTSGPDANGPLSNNFGNNPPSCGTTGSDGTVTCPVANVGGANGAGTDNVQFWVNQSSGATAGPDPGEPKTTATATFTAPPTYTSITVTCTTPGATPPTGGANANCTVPTDQNTVTFSAYVKNNTTPVSGAIVTFAITPGGGNTGTAPSPTNGTVTTNSSGVATFTVTDTGPKAGDTITAHAQIGANAGISGTSTATYATRAAGTYTLTPALQTVSNGGTVTVTETVTDQFGAGVPGVNVSFNVVSGRNAGKTGAGTTDSSGKAVFSYTDAAVNPSQSTDTINATANSATRVATVSYISGSSAASTITVDVSGTCPAGPFPTTPSSTHSAALGATTSVCALVKNSTGQTLAGKTVTFTVSQGQVSATNPVPAAATTTATADTDQNGVAAVYVTSTKSGNQTVTATADTATGSGTVTYAAPAASTARNVTLSPPSATVPANGQQQYTATVQDQYGNGVPGVSVAFTATNGATFGAGASSQTVTTNSNGAASITLTVPGTNGTTGNVTADITSNPANDCAATAGPGGTPAAGNCTATSTYTVGVPDMVTLTRVTNSGVVGRPITISGKTLNGATVTVTGWNPRHGAYTVGTATADSSGNWTKTFVVWYNTAIAAHEGTAVSAEQHIQVHSDLHFTLTLDKHNKSGYHYTLTGRSAPQINNEFIGVQYPKGGAVGGDHASSTGRYTIHFTLKHKGSHSLYLYANGRFNGKRVLDAFRQHFTLNQV